MKRSYFWFLIVLLCSGISTTPAAETITVSFQDGIDGYTGARDTKLLSASPDMNWGEAAELELDGSPETSSLLYWDVSVIPQDAVVQSCEIIMTISNASSDYYEIYQMLKPWVELEATWEQYQSGKNWEIPGADGTTDRKASILASFNSLLKATISIPLNSQGISVVQSWVSDPATNHGFIIMDYENASNGLEFKSRETGTVTERPTLTITYEIAGLPLVSIDDIFITEGNSGSVDALFTVSLSKPGQDEITVNYATLDGDATTADNDYNAASGSLTFLPDELFQTLTVQVNGDVLNESNEIFFVNLDTPVNAEFGDNQAKGTILDDDGPLEPDIAVDPSSHDYSKVQVGLSVSKVFTINNEGSVDLTISNTLLSGFDAADFVIESGGAPVIILPGRQHELSVSFTPATTGVKQAVLQIDCDDPDESSVDISLFGNALSAPGEPITFTVTGDYPYQDELALFQQHIDKHNLYSPSEFFVHVGDILYPQDGCHQQVYLDVANILKTLAVPAFIVIGDNDWTDCIDPDQAFQWWYDQFVNFEENFCGSPVVERQAERVENWSFVMNGVLFTGINNPGSSAGSDDRSSRLQDDADWVDFQFQQKATQIRAAIVFGHSGPSDSERLFFDQFVTSSVELAKPVFYIQGHDHDYLLDNPWPAENMQRLIVPRGADEDPLQITVTMDLRNLYEIVRDPWNPTPQLYNHQPCVNAGPDQTINLAELCLLSGEVNDDSVPLDPGELSTTWSKLSGPGEVMFADAHSLATTAQFNQAGTYTLSLTADDGELLSSDEILVNVSGNSGTGVMVQIKAFLEGPYDQTAHNMTTILGANDDLPLQSPYANDPVSVQTIPTQVTDWVGLQISESVAGPEIAFKSLFLRNDGQVITPDDASSHIVFDAPEGEYFVTLVHRNHLSVTSATAIALSFSSVVLFDFTLANEQYYETRATKEMEPNIWGIAAGDINQDLFLTTKDYALWTNSQRHGDTGYTASDLNLDSVVSQEDFAIWQENARAGLSSLHP